jgi:hypothetical protein
MLCEHRYNIAEAGLRFRNSLVLNNWQASDEEEDVTYSCCIWRTVNVRSIILGSETVCEREN